MSTPNQQPDSPQSHSLRYAVHNQSLMSAPGSQTHTVRLASLPDPQHLVHMKRSAVSPGAIPLPEVAILSATQSATPITSGISDAAQDALMMDLDLILQGPQQSSFYGGKGASFEKLQQLGGVLRITAQLRRKNGDLLQLMPGEAPTLEALLTVCDNTGTDLVHVNTINMGMETPCD